MKNDVKDAYRILFISINSVWRYGNIGMDQLLGYLRTKGYNIDILYFSNREKVEEICKKIGLSYDMYAFSVNSANYKKCKEIASSLKHNVKKSIIVFGGGYPTRYYREIAKETKCVDYMILGDGEIPSEYLLDCLSKIKSGEKVNISHNAIASENDCNNKKDYYNAMITWEPAYDYYEKDNNCVNSRKVHCIQIKNNVCTGNCSFCTERHGKVVYKDINAVVDQIEYVNRKFDVEKIYFTDDNILDPNTEQAKEHLKALCIALKERKMNVSYQCYIKAFSLRDCSKDRDLLALMREVGFVEIFVGIEAGNQEDLNLYNKYTTVEQNYNIIALLKEYDIFPIIGYIAFNPYSTKERIQKNFKFLCDIECTYLHNYLYSFAVVNKYTAMYDMIKRDGLLAGTEEDYLGVKYRYQHDEVREVLEYVENEMLPKLRQLDYELDWVTYSAMEHEVSHKNIRNYRPALAQRKIEDAKWIKEHLKYLFIDFDVESFKKVEKEFWDYFKDEETFLREIYDYYISLHY